MSQPGGGGPWLADVRPRVLNKLMSDLARIYQGQLTPCPQELHTLAVEFEERLFREATSKEDYMRNIANMLINEEKKQRQEQQRQQLLQVTQGLQEQIHMGGQMLLANAVQAIQGGNSSVTAMPQVTPMAGPGRPSSQLQSLPMTQQNSGLVPNQHMAYPSAADMQIKVKQEQPGMMAVLDHILNFQPPKVAPMALGVQPSQRPMQSVEAQSQNQHLPTNFAGCNPTSMTQLQGQPIVRPSVQQNHLLRKNASGIATQQLQQQEQELQLMRMNQQNLRDNQQQMDRQRYQMIGSQQANVTKMQIGHPGGQNNQQNARRTDVLQSPFNVYAHDALRKQINMKPEPRTPPQRHIAGGQQSSLLCQSPQTSATMESAGEADWREEMLQKIKSLKDACFSELMEFDQTVNVPKITKEHFYSLPREKADRIKNIAKSKDTIRNVLNFLQLPKSNIPEGLKGQFPQIQTLVRNLVHVHRKRKVQNADLKTGRQVQNCREQPQIINLSRDSAPFTGGMRQQNQQEQSADASISLLRQTIGTRTPPALQQNHRNHLLGLSSPCFPIKSPGALQSLPTNKLEECCTPSPIAKTGAVQAATPRASVKSTSSSPIVKPGVVQVASPHASVKSTSPSPIAKPAVVSVASPCALVKSTLPSPIAKPVVVQVASPCASVKSTLSEDCDSVSAFLLHDNGAAAPNGSNQVTPTKVIMSASPLQAETPAGQAEDQMRGGAETPVAKKPIDRLVDAVLSSSPAALRSSANSIWSVLSMSDCVPHGEVGTFQDWTFSQQRGGSSTLNKMKRVFDHTTSRSESPPLGSMDGSCVTAECDASDSESSGEHIVKRQKTQNANNVLWEEIKAINSTLIDTVISIIGDNGTDGISSCNGGTTIELSYTALSLAPSLKSLLATSEMSLVMPAKLFVPSDYPRSSPVLLNYQGEDQLRKLTDISDAVGVAFRRAVSDLPEPRSIKGTARSWDACVRRAVMEFADRLGGGTFSWRLSRWES